MTAFSEVQILEKKGFVVVSDEGFSTTLKHDCGLTVCISEHQWSVENQNEGWTEEGTLDDTKELYQIVKEYIGK